MKRLLFVAPLLALAPGMAAAQRAPAGESVRIAYTEETLPNGLKVLYHVDRSAPVAAVAVWYNVGSKHEQPGRTGFAHLFEHMMFKGSRNVPDGRHFALLEDAGARAGSDINGTTNTDRTNYFETVPSNQVELALWLESDRMGTLTETLNPGKLENQREVVKNERRQSYENQPYGVWQERMLAKVFPVGHPYHHSVIGSMEDLSAATVDDVTSFFRTYYAPNNAVLVVAGDIDVERTKAMVRKHFSDIRRGPAPPPLRSMTLPPIIGQGSREVIEDANAPAPAVYIGFRMPAARDRQGDAVQLLTGMLSSRTGPLFQSLVRGRQVATGAGAFNFGFVDGADLMIVTATGKPGARPDSLEAALTEELDRIAASITPAALDRIKVNARFALINGLQTMGGFGGRADVLAQGYTFYRDPNWINTRLQAIQAVTAAQMQALVRERMVPANRAVLVFVPKPRPATPAPTTATQVNR
jgi:predicted Zn-dependent peptidase